MSPDLLKYGKAVTQSVVLHLQYLFQGSDKFDEMPSMSVISPPGKLYGVPQNVGFSFPVRTAQGKWTIVEVNHLSLSFLFEIDAFHSVSSIFIYANSPPVLFDDLDHGTPKWKT